MIDEIIRTSRKGEQPVAARIVGMGGIPSCRLPMKNVKRVIAYVKLVKTAPYVAFVYLPISRFVAEYYAVAFPTCAVDAVTLQNRIEQEVTVMTDDGRVDDGKTFVVPADDEIPPADPR